MSALPASPVSIFQPKAPAAFCRDHSDGFAECSPGRWSGAKSSLQHLIEPSHPHVSWVLGSQLHFTGRRPGSERLRNSPFTQPAHTELGFKPRSGLLSSWSALHRASAPSERPTTPCLAPCSREFLGDGIQGSTLVSPSKCPAGQRQWSGRPSLSPGPSRALAPTWH